MADQQGTGEHPHKSAAEPHEHHEAPTTKGASHSSSESHAKSGSHESTSHASSESHSDGQGTGKHPHKKASDPHEHHEGAKASK